MKLLLFLIYLKVFVCPLNSLVAQTVKNPLVVQDTACNAGETRAISGLGRSSGEENGNLLQYSCLGNPMDRGASWAIVHGVTKSRT